MKKKLYVEIKVIKSCYECPNREINYNGLKCLLNGKYSVNGIEIFKKPKRILPDWCELKDL